MRFGPRVSLGLLCGLYLAAGTALSGVGPSLAQLALNSGVEIAALGGLFTAVAGGGVLAQFGAGPLGERAGQRPVLGLGALLMGLGMLGISFSIRLDLMLLCALLAGLGFGCLLAGGNVLAAQLFPTRRASALSLLNLCFGLGSILGPTIAGLAAVRFGIPQAVLWCGAGLLLIQLLLVPGYAEATAPPARSSLRAAAGIPALWLIGLMLLIYTGLEIAIGGWVVELLQRGAAITAAEAAFGATSFWAALTVGRGLGALLGLRMTPQMLLLICVIGLIFGASGLFLAIGNLTAMLAALMLLGLSCGPIFPSAMAITAFVGRGSSSAASLVLALGNLGGLGIPALLGVLLVGSGPPAGALMILACGLIMSAILTFLFRLQNTPTQVALAER
ncbi:MAG: MFS transporter [Oscillochloris sp.]|nr:MFS transporter [Oscillochloris sp.]